MPVFFLPAAFWGFLILGGLVAIYFFRHRSRDQKVSSLLLWAVRQKPTEGGVVFRGPHLPLLLLLEILAVSLLVLGAARPKSDIREGAIPLVVILDDSYSMLAGGSDSPRSRAEKALFDELDRQSRYQVRFISAGLKPEFLGEATDERARMALALKEWTCTQAGTDLGQAVLLALENSGPNARFLVLTDQPPPEDDTQNRVQWWAFGRPEANLAFTNAARHTLDGTDRCFIEVTNFSSQPARCVGSIETPPVPGILQDLSCEIEPRGCRRFFFDLADPSRMIRATLASDAMALDNLLVLVPAQQRAVSVQNEIRAPVLRKLVERALLSTGNALVRPFSTELFVTDDPDAVASSSASWIVEFLAEKEARSYLGPFAMDRLHPLCEGIFLEGLLWGAGSGAVRIPGTPIITAENLPLVTDERDENRGHHVRIRFKPEFSTFHSSPNWPILFWNILDQCRLFKPGPIDPNIRLGGMATVPVSSETQEVTVKAPSGAVQSVVPQDRMALFLPPEAGLFELTIDQARYWLGVNSLSEKESDISKATTGTWGDWTRSSYFERSAADISWAFLLPALAILTFHLYLCSKISKGVQE